MYQRRGTKLRPALPPLTPEPPERKPVGTLTLEEAHAEVINLKRLLTAERRRNAAIENVLLKHLAETELKADAARTAFFEAQALAMRPSEREIK
jgi:hypothetical protein